MAGRTGKKRWMVILVAIVAGFLKWKYPEFFDEAGTGPGSVQIPEGTSYETYQNCSLVNYRNNDGDSFMVKFPDGRETEMRLYYVDAPESKVKTYRGGDSNLERIQDQAKDLGGLSVEQTTEIGQAAKTRVKQLLMSPFTVVTRHEKVYGSAREYGFIQPDGGRDYLHEILVDEGLGRIHTSGAELPDGTSVKNQKKQLKRLEEKAKRERQGAWAF